MPEPAQKNENKAKVLSKTVCCFKIAYSYLLLQLRGNLDFLQKTFNNITGLDIYGL